MNIEKIGQTQGRSKKTRELIRDLSTTKRRLRQQESQAAAVQRRVILRSGQTNTSNLLEKCSNGSRSGNGMWAVDAMVLS